MSLTKGEITSFHELGYLLAKAPAWHDLKQNLARQFLSTAKKIIAKNKSWSSQLNLAETENLQSLLVQINDLEEKKNISGLSAILYEFFPKIIPSYNLLTDTKMLNTLEQLGCEFPVPATVPVSRIDRPQNEYFLTPWHQDYWYSFVSTRSITVWIPIFKLTQEMGFLEVIPKSHRSGLIPFREFSGYEPFEAVFDETKLEKKIEVPVAEDEILIFYQTLLHRSRLNTSTTPRLSIQLRYNDLEHLDVLQNSFRPVHSDYVKQKQTESLNNWKANGYHQI